MIRMRSFLPLITAGGLAFGPLLASAAEPVEAPVTLPMPGTLLWADAPQPQTSVVRPVAPPVAEKPQPAQPAPVQRAGFFTRMFNHAPTATSAAPASKSSSSYSEPSWRTDD